MFHPFLPSPTSATCGGPLQAASLPSPVRSPSSRSSGTLVVPPASSQPSLAVLPPAAFPLPHRLQGALPSPGATAGYPASAPMQLSSEAAENMTINALRGRSVYFGGPMREPRTLMAWDIIVAFQKGRLCLSCDSLTHSMPKCPNGAFVCPNCHRKDHRGNECTRICRFCGTSHPGISIMNCLKDTSKIVKHRSASGGNSVPSHEAASGATSDFGGICAAAPNRTYGFPSGSTSCCSDVSPYGGGVFGASLSTGASLVPLSLNPPPPPNSPSAQTHHLSFASVPSQTTGAAEQARLSHHGDPTQSNNPFPPASMVHPDAAQQSSSSLQHINVANSSRPNNSYGRTVWVSRLPPTASDADLATAVNGSVKTGRVASITRKKSGLDWAYVEMDCLEAAFEMVSKKVVLHKTVLKIQFRKSHAAILLDEKKTPDGPPATGSEGVTMETRCKRADTRHRSAADEEAVAIRCKRDYPHKPTFSPPPGFEQVNELQKPEHTDEVCLGHVRKNHQTFEEAERLLWPKTVGTEQWGKNDLQGDLRELGSFAGIRSHKALPLQQIMAAGEKPDHRNLYHRVSSDHPSFWALLSHHEATHQDGKHRQEETGRCATARDRDSTASGNSRKSSVCSVAGNWDSGDGRTEEQKKWKNKMTESELSESNGGGSDSENSEEDKILRVMAETNSSQGKPGFPWASDMASEEWHTNSKEWEEGVCGTDSVTGAMLADLLAHLSSQALSTAEPMKQVGQRKKATQVFADAKTSSHNPVQQQNGAHQIYKQTIISESDYSTCMLGKPLDANTVFGSDEKVDYLHNWKKSAERTEMSDLLTTSDCDTCSLDLDRSVQSNGLLATLEPVSSDGLNSSSKSSKHCSDAKGELENALVDTGTDEIRSAFQMCEFAANGMPGKNDNFELDDLLKLEGHVEATYRKAINHIRQERMRRAAAKGMTG